MSHVSALVEPLDFELITDDGEPLENPRHLEQMNLTLEGMRRVMAERGRGDFFTGGNMFVYFSPAQAQAVAEDERRRLETGESPDDKTFRGPDAFFVNEVEGHERDAWVVWEEGHRYPDVIFEYLSKTTKHIDKGEKKDLYAHTFRTPELFHWDPKSFELEGFRLLDHEYQSIRPARGWRPPEGKEGGTFLWSGELEVWVGPWEGTYKGITSTWLRIFDREGRLVPTSDEIADEERQRADQERQRADQERQRADQAAQRADQADQGRRRAEEEQRRSAEQNARLRARLGELGDEIPE